MKEIYDMHSHILPSFDDGARDVEESHMLLKQASDQGVRAMVCSSHFYPRETVQEFLNRRNAAVEEMKNVLPHVGFPLPRLFLGAEAAWFPGMPHVENIEKLCIGKSRYMLVEPDFGLWTETFYQDLHVFTNVLGITPIIAHLERYLDIQDKKRIQRLLECDVLIQMNASCIINPKSAGTAKKLLKKGCIDLLGSDCHRIDTRPETIGLAFEQLQRWKMEDELDHIIGTSRRVLRITD